ncbi:MAG: DUF2254 domain-containing protein [Bacteroidota bacterium]
MSSIRAFFQRGIQSILGSIAFIPTLYVLGFVGLAILMRVLEFHGLSRWMGKEGYFWLVSSEATARTLLSTIIAGLISLTVFSFSMVMVVLGQATNTLSPRLLPKLIEDRSHQTVLGIYLGVISFAYLTLMAIVPLENRSLPSFTVFICVLLAIFCLALFVYFIASISSRIQVDHITHQIYREAKEDLDYWQSAPENWGIARSPFKRKKENSVAAPESGYIDLPLFQQLSSLAAEQELGLFVSIPRGEFITKGRPLLYLSQPPTPAQLQRFKNQIKLASTAEDNFNYLLAIRHISEITVKAMSPGINDPGTALNAITLLEDLILRCQQLPQLSSYQSANGSLIYFKAISFSELIQPILAELRCYGKSDPNLMRRITRLIISLKLHPQDEQQLKMLDLELDALREDGRESLRNPLDRQRFEQFIQQHSTN